MGTEPRPPLPPAPGTNVQTRSQQQQQFGSSSREPMGCVASVLKSYVPGMHTLFSCSLVLNSYLRLKAFSSPRTVLRRLCFKVYKRQIINTVLNVLPFLFRRNSIPDRKREKSTSGHVRAFLCPGLCWHFTLHPAYPSRPASRVVMLPLLLTDRKLRLHGIKSKPRNK